MRGSDDPLRRNGRDLRAQTRARTSRLQTPWCRWDCESELKMEIPAEISNALAFQPIPTDGSAFGLGAPFVGEPPLVCSAPANTGISDNTKAGIQVGVATKPT